VEDALPARYGFRDDTTFYTEHGDVFATLCAILGLVAAGWSGRKILSESLGRNVKSKARS
jgi:apolipoprotein N-acyltransferase